MTLTFHLTESFILRWGTHYIKSAKFGGHLRLTRTKTFKGSADVSEFAETANQDAQALFSNSQSTHIGHTWVLGHNTFETTNTNSNAEGVSESTSSRQTSQAT